MTLIYILQSVNHPEKYYIGLTKQPALRLEEHNSGRNFHTAKWRPWRLTVCVAFADHERAVEFERYLKSGSGRAFLKKHL